MGELSKWSKSSKSSPRRARVARVRVQRRSRGDYGSGYNATFVVATTSCVNMGNRKKLKKSFTPPDTRCPGPFAHIDNPLGWDS